MTYNFAKGEFINLTSLLKGALELSEIVNSSVIKMSPHGMLEANPKGFKNKILALKNGPCNPKLVSIYVSSHPEKNVLIVALHAGNSRMCIPTRWFNVARL